MEIRHLICYWLFTGVIAIILAMYTFRYKKGLYLKEGEDLLLLVGIFFGPVTLVLYLLKILPIRRIDT